MTRRHRVTWLILYALLALTLAINGTFVVTRTGLWYMNLASLLFGVAVTSFIVGWRRGFRENKEIVAKAVAAAMRNAFGWMPRSVDIDRSEETTTAFVHKHNGEVVAIEIPQEVESPDEALAFVFGELERTAPNIGEEARGDEAGK